MKVFVLFFYINNTSTYPVEFNYYGQCLKAGEGFKASILTAVPTAKIAYVCVDKNK